MSSISFATRSRSVRLRGAERFHMASICSKVAMSGLNIYDTASSPSWTRKILPQDHYALRYQSNQYEQALVGALGTGWMSLRHPTTGVKIDTFAITLNTALVLGSDVVKLMARLHGQCEIHAFIPPWDAKFIAGLIESGLRPNLFRQDMGWKEVSDLLNHSATSEETVVTSFSVTESFPGWDGETDSAKDWDTELARLDPTLCLKEENWSSYHFGDGTTFMSLEKAAGGT